MELMIMAIALVSLGGYTTYLHKRLADSKAEADLLWQLITQEL